MRVYFRQYLAERPESQHRGIRDKVRTKSRDRVPRSCRALLPMGRATFVPDARVQGPQAQGIALETILAETRQNREWFSAK
jgi:hypothetical protein